METTRLAAASERFGALYERWDGAIPLDDLGPYLAWYATLGASDQRTFRLCALYAVLGVAPGRNAEDALRVLWRLAEWFPG